MRKWIAVAEGLIDTKQPCYIAKNKVTGEQKRFKTFTQMQCWYVTLNIMDMLDWSSWEVSY